MSPAKRGGEEDTTFDRYVAIDSVQNKEHSTMSNNPLFLNTRSFNTTTHEYQKAKGLMLSAQKSTRNGEGQRKENKTQILESTNS